MNGDLEQEVQQAIIQRIAGDTTLSALVGDRVWPFVPQKPDDKTFPFIQVGDFNSADAGDKSDPGEDMSAMFNVFSRERGNDELQAITRAIKRLFHEQPLTLSSGEAFLVRFQNRNNNRLSDGVTRASYNRYLIKTSETSYLNPDT